MNKKLFVKLQGGLGNQLFQLAAGMSAAKFQAIDVVLVTGNYVGRDRRFYELKSLEETLGITSQQFVNPLNFPDKINEIKEFEFQKIVMKSNRNSILEGYFQNPDYVAECGLELIHAFTTSGMNTEKNIGCKCSKMHVGIHVRRGDYNLPVNKDLFGILHEDYFAQIASEFTDAHFSVFTDGDIDSGILKITGDADIYGRDISAWATLSSMASMDSLVISNSSLSWWGAFFGRSLNSEQVTISPRNWFRKLPGSNNLILEHWINHENTWLS
jgi:hypothetical protein